MKPFIKHLLAILIILSSTACSIQSQPIHFDKNKIAKVDLLVGDSAIWNEWQYHQDLGLMVVDGDVYFVDSTGSALHKPMQKITFIDAMKDSLIDLINSFPTHNNDSNSKTCILLFRHSFLCYTKDNELIGKADICFDCATMNYANSNSKGQADLEQNEKSYNSLVTLLRSRNVYLYNVQLK